MKRHPLLAVVTLLILAILGAWWLIWKSMERAGPHSRVQRDLSDIVGAIRVFQSEFNEEPPILATDFFNSLRGGNARGIRFLLDDRADYKSGIRCDQWGNPYQVFRSSDGWLVRSSGPNGLFDDLCLKEVDDITAFTPTITSPKADPAGAFQPATQPADKVPAEVQPPPPTSKAGPR